MGTFVAVLNPVDAKWMPLDEFLKLDYYKTGVYGKMFAIGLEATRGHYSGFETEELPFVYRRGTTYLYHAKL